jgi:hypothetical protein
VSRRSYVLLRHHLAPLRSPITGGLMKRNGRPRCQLCGGNLSWTDWRTGEEHPGCETHAENEPALCSKYWYLRRELDADDLGRPYVTTGPYCPWPQPNFQKWSAKQT